MVNTGVVAVTIATLLQQKFCRLHLVDLTGSLADFSPKPDAEGHSYHPVIHLETIRTYLSACPKAGGFLGVADWGSSWQRHHFEICPRRRAV